MGTAGRWPKCSSRTGSQSSILVSFTRGRDDTADRRSFAQFYLKVFRLFLHSNPSQFADEMKNFNGWALIVALRGRDFSTLQIGVHSISLPHQLLREQFSPLLAA